MKPFISWTYAPEINAERCEIVLTLVRDILEGVADQHERSQHPQAEVLTAAVKARLYDAQVPRFASSSNRKFKPQDAGNTAELLVKAFQDGLKFSFVRELKLAPPLSMKYDQALVARELKCEVQQYFEASPSVDGALMMARYNLERTRTRQVMTYALSRLLQVSEHHDVPLSGMSEIRETLWSREAKFLRNVVLFGCLAGGDDAKAAIRELALSTCHKEDPTEVRFSIMHFLQHEGRSPGSYYTAEDDAFRADIEQKFKNL